MIILLVFLNAEVRQMVSFCLKSRYHAELIEVGTAAEAIAHFDLNKDAPDLIISDGPLNSERLLEFLAKKKLSIPFLVCTGATRTGKGPLAPGMFFAAPGAVLGKADSLIRDYLNEATIVESDQSQEFLSIRTKLLLNASPLETDLYIRLAPDKFLKLMLPGDHFDSADYEKYGVKKQIPHLYIHRNGLTPVIEKFQAEITRLLASNASPEAATELAVMIEEASQELILKLGPTPEIQEMVRKNIELAIHSMGRNPKLKNILDRLHEEKSRYISAHSIHFAQVCCALAAAMEWHSEATFQKLCMAAYLHDITLTNHELARVSSIAELETLQNGFTEKEVEDFRAHPVRAAEIAQQFSEIPPDVDQLIMLHHEQPDGSGFPKNLSHTQMGPLAAVFILGHELVKTLFEENEKLDMRKFLGAMQARYDFGNFRKVLKVLGRLEV